MDMIRIGVIGEFEEGRESHKALLNSLAHSGTKIDVRIGAKWIDTAEIAESGASRVLTEFDGVWAAPGQPYRSTQGALAGIRWARESGIPFLGTCQGFQHAALEYAVSVTGYGFQPDWEKSGEVLSPLVCIPYDSISEFSVPRRESILYQAYRADHFKERFRCRYCLNRKFVERLNGVHWTAFDEEKEPVAFEVQGHPFFLATLFQPHMSSTEQGPNSVVTAFLSACHGKGK